MLSIHALGVLQRLSQRIEYIVEKIDLVEQKLQHIMESGITINIDTNEPDDESSDGSSETSIASAQSWP